MPQRVGGGNDPQSEVYGEPGVFIIVGVAIEGGAIPAQDVLQTSIREVASLRGRHHHQAVRGRIHPLIGRPGGNERNKSAEALIKLAPPAAAALRLLGVGSDPVDDAVLVEVMLMSEGEGLSFPQLPHKDEGRTLKVIPLLRHLQDAKESERLKLHNYTGMCECVCVFAASPPSSAGTAPETPRLRAVPSSTCVPSGRSAPSRPELAQDGTSTSSSRSAARTHKKNKS